MDWLAAAQSAHAELSQLLLATTADFLAAREPAGHLATARGEHGAASRCKAVAMLDVMPALIPTLIPTLIHR